MKYIGNKLGWDFYYIKKDFWSFGLVVSKDSVLCYGFGYVIEAYRDDYNLPF